MRHLHTDSGGNALHELKVHAAGGLRLYLILSDGVWYATHGTKKVSDKRVPAEITKAFDIFYFYMDSKEK
ncbi:hypothetical protein JOE38_002907 [Clavibacter michiganensis]|nr:hypothetical protein [Clavibacter michiganensis]